MLCSGSRKKIQNFFIKTILKFQLFVGNWEEVMGTDLIFSEMPHRHLLNFIASSSKRLVAQQVLLVPKEKKSQNFEAADSEEMTDILNSELNIENGDDIPELETSM